jgi:hypothetical protein
VREEVAMETVGRNETSAIGPLHQLMNLATEFACSIFVADEFDV